jgi:hypothetical protein
MNPLDAVERDLLAEGIEDVVGVWEVIRRVRQECPGLSAEEVRRTTLHTVKQLLDQRFMEVGGALREDGTLDRWDVSAEDVLARIAAAWTELGREPDVWDIGWLVTTEAGEKAVQTHDHQLRQAPRAR